MLNLKVADIVKNPKEFINKTYRYKTKFRPNATFIVSYIDIMIGPDWTEVKFVGDINDPIRNKISEAEEIYSDDPDLYEIE